MASKGIVIKSSTITCILGGTALFLVIASFSGQLIVHFTGHPTVFGFVPLFNVDNEGNFPTFSTLLLLIAAALLMVISLQEKNCESTQTSHWRTLSIVFIMMAIDEYVGLHESLGEPTDKLLGTNHPGIFYYPWVIPGMLIVLIFGLYYLKFWSALPRKRGSLFLWQLSCISPDALGWSF